jgi:hypothetical protein
MMLRKFYKYVGKWKEMTSAQKLSAGTNHFGRVTEYEQKVCYGSGSHNLAVQNQTSGLICMTNQCLLLSGPGGKWDKEDFELPTYA